MLRVGDGTFLAIANVMTTATMQIEKSVQLASSSCLTLSAIITAVIGPPRISSGL